MKRQKIIAIVGPTAIGKTGLSIKIAGEVHGEIISADSRQVYCGLDLGTGKVTTEEMEGVPHHLIDIAEPWDIFSAADFMRLGTEALRDIARRGRVPLVVGGTGFYIDALLGRRMLAAVPPNQAVRLQLSGYSVDELQKKLKELDPGRFETVDRNNPRRLVRAIEIAKAGVRSQESGVKNTEVGPLYEVLWVGLTMPHIELKKKIQARLSARLGAGMLEEAKHLHAEGLSFSHMEALGLEYRSMARHLQGKIFYDEMVAELEKDIAAYAKRQMTWFKKNKEIRWFAPDEREKILEAVKGFIKSAVTRH